MADSAKVMEAGVIGAVAAYVVYELASQLDFGTGAVGTMVETILPILIAVGAILGVLKAT